MVTKENFATETQIKLVKECQAKINDIVLQMNDGLITTKEAINKLNYLTSQNFSSLPDIEQVWVGSDQNIKYLEFLNEREKQCIE